MKASVSSSEPTTRRTHVVIDSKPYDFRHASHRFSRKTSGRTQPDAVPAQRKPVRTEFHGVLRVVVSVPLDNRSWGKVFKFRYSPLKFPARRLSWISLRQTRRWYQGALRVSICLP